MRGDRIVAQHRVPGLDEITRAEDCQRAEQRERHARDIGGGRNGKHDEKQGGRQHKGRRVDDEAGRKCEACKPHDVILPPRPAG